MREPAEQLKLPARTAAGTNWTAAFLLYAKGASLQEISDEMGIAFSKLKDRCRKEDWENMVKLNGMLALKAPSSEVAPVSAIKLKDVEKRIEANREEALAVASGLRSHIKRTLDAYSEGNVFLSPTDIATLARAASQIDTCAMQALGDDPAPKLMPGQGAKPPEERKPNGPVTHFHIHPPAVAMQPRVTKRVGEVIETPLVAGRQVDAVLTPTPPRREVELSAEGKADEECPVVETAGGRATIDFKKLAKEVSSVPLPKPGTGIPEFARAG